MKKLQTQLLKAFAPLIIFFVVWSLLPSLSKREIKSLFFNIQSPIWKAKTQITNMKDEVSLLSKPKKQIINECKELAQENAFLKIELANINEKSIELERLNDLLHLSQNDGFRSEIARVIRRDTSSWWHTMVVNKGENFGIKKGMAVISARGIVGRIAEVHIGTAVVDLTTSPQFRMAARIEGDLRPIIYRGNSNDAFSQPHGIAENIPLDFRKNISDKIRLVSTSFGGNFPEGLTIGYIYSVETADDGFFLRSNVFLDRELLDLSEVAILIPTNQE